jgi:hypothetical protein
LPNNQKTQGTDNRGKNILGMLFPEFTEVETTFTCSADATCHFAVFLFFNKIFGIVIGVDE